MVKWKHLKKQWWKILRGSPKKTGVFKFEDKFGDIEIKKQNSQQHKEPISIKKYRY